MNLEDRLTQLNRVGKDHLNLYKEDFDKDSYEAFKDFCTMCFYRFRKDELSEKYSNYAKQAMDKLVTNINISNKKVKFLEDKGKLLIIKYQQITESNLRADKKGPIKTNKNDKKLLLSICFDFIPQLEIYNYSIRNMAKYYFDDGKIKNFYKELRKINGVGPKIASMCVRDLLFFYINSYSNTKINFFSLSDDLIYFLFPIDTWVKQICRRLFGIEGSDKEIIIEMIELCKKAKVSPIYVNHGIWYLGVKSQELILDNLENIQNLKVINK